MIETSHGIEADLHCHTTASDGDLAPWELVEKASRCGLQAVAITDHDTISGWDEAETAGEFFGIDVLTGIELSTRGQGQEVHILGYGMDPEARGFTEVLNTIQEARFTRMREMLNKLKGMGINIGFPEIESIARGESIGRPHIAQALINQGIVESVQDAFERYIGSKAPAFVPRYKITAEEGIGLIRKAGGIAVLAHPGKNKLSPEDITNWTASGLRGIEVYHPDHTPSQNRYFEEIARENKLIITGGSDYHGHATKPGIYLGQWGVSLDAVRKIRKALKPAP